MPLVHDDHRRRWASLPVAHACLRVGSSHRSASRSRSSTPSSSPPASNAWAYTTLSTGRRRISSSGSALSQPSSVASCLLRRMAGTASSTRSAARCEILGGQRVADRIGRRAMLLVPRARAPVQRGDQLGLLRPQMRGEHVGKEVVIAIPVTPVVQRNDKEVAALERLQPRRAVLLAGDGIAQRATATGRGWRSGAGSRGQRRADAAGPLRPGSPRRSGGLRRRPG